jgi:hypothetical protein
MDKFEAFSQSFTQLRCGTEAYSLLSGQGTLSYVETEHLGKLSGRIARLDGWIGKKVGERACGSCAYHTMPILIHCIKFAFDLAPHSETPSQQKGIPIACFGTSASFQ